MPDVSNHFPPDMRDALVAVASLPADRRAVRIKAITAELVRRGLVWGPADSVALAAQRRAYKPSTLAVWLRQHGVPLAPKRAGG